MFRHIITFVIPYKPKLNYYQDYVNTCKGTINGETKLIAIIIGVYMYGFIICTWLTASSRLSTFDRYLMADVVHFLFTLKGFNLVIVLLGSMAIYFYTWLYFKVNIKLVYLIERLLQLGNIRAKVTNNLFINKRYRGNPVGLVMQRFAWKLVNIFQVMVLVLGMC